MKARRLRAGLMGALASSGGILLAFRGPFGDPGLYGLTVAGLLILGGALLGEALDVATAVVEIALGTMAAVAGAEPGPVLDTLGGLGSVMIMYMAGLEVDPAVLRRRLSASLLGGLSSFLVPMVVGFLALHALGFDPLESLLASIACSTTSVAVVYAITRRSGILRSPLGQVVISAAMVADVASIVAFAAVAGGHGVPGHLTAAYLAGSVFAAYASARLIDWVSGGDREAEVRGLLALVALMALVGEELGGHAILYAFLLGMATRRMVGRLPGLEERLTGITFGFLAPIFFVDAGLHAAPRNPLLYGELALLLLAATLPAKIAATHISLRAATRRRVPARLSSVFAARLTVSTVIAFAGEKAGLLPHDLAGAIIFSALIATITAAVLARAPLELEAA